jgi:hypothetical protein
MVLAKRATDAKGGPTDRPFSVGQVDPERAQWLRDVNAMPSPRTRMFT